MEHNITINNPGKIAAIGDGAFGIIVNVESPKPAERELAFPDLIAAVKRYYQQEKFQQLTSDFHHPMPIKDCYVNLAIVREKEQYDKEKQLKAAEHEKEIEKDKKNFYDQRYSSYEEIYGVKEPIAIENLFKPATYKGESIPKQLLILGRAGIGKSTLCQYIAYCWSQEEKSGQSPLWKDEPFKLILWIPLRRLINKNRYPANEALTLGTVIHRECLSADDQIGITPGQLDPLLCSIKDQILYVLDGYDEVASGVNRDEHTITCPGKFINELLSKPRVLITSRPYYIEDYLAKKGMKVHKLENIGFTTENVNTYTRLFFRQACKPTLTEPLIHYLNTHPNIKGIAHIPINLMLICSAWKNHYKEEEMLPESLTMTELYQSLVSDRTWQYLKNHPETEIPDVRKWHELCGYESKCAPFLTFLGRLAFQQMQEIGLIIEPKILGKFLQANKDEKILSKILQFGLLKATGEQGRQEVDNSYYFVHLTFQEFFAAYYWVHQFISENPKERIGAEQFFKEKKWERRYEIMWWFVAGLLKSHQMTTRNQTNSLILERFYDLFECEPKDLLGFADQLLRMRCLEEAGLEMTIDRRTEWLKELATCLTYAVKNKQESFIDYLALSPRLIKQSILINAYLELLNNKDKRIQVSAIETLGRQALPTAIVERLGTLLADTEWTVREAAAEALGKQTALPVAIVERLVTLLADADWKVRRAATEALGKQTALPAAIVERLVALLADANGYVREAAAEALGKQAALPAAIVERLATLLADADWKVREAAAQALGKQAVLSAAIVERLVALLVDANGKVRWAAVEALGKQTALPAAIVERLVTLLADADGKVREAAAQALGKQAALPAAIVERLVTLLADADGKVREAAAQALGKQAALPAAIVERLATLLADADGKVRWAAVEALGKQAALPAAIVERLVTLLADAEWNVVWGASAEALGKQTALPAAIVERLVTLLADADGNVQGAAAQVLGKQAVLPVAIVERLGMLLADADWYVRRAAAEALGKQAALPVAIVERLVMLLADANGNVRWAAAEVLGKQAALPIPIYYELGKLLLVSETKENFANAMNNLSIQFIIQSINSSELKLSSSVVAILLFKSLQERMPIYYEKKNLYFGNNNTFIIVHSFRNKNFNDDFEKILIQITGINRKQISKITTFFNFLIKSPKPENQVTNDDDNKNSSSNEAICKIM